MHFKGYEKISNGVYCAEEMRLIPDCTTDQVVLLSYFKHPGVEEVGTSFGIHLARLEEHGSENELDQILFSLPDDFREGLKTGSDLVRKIVAEELYPYFRDTYLRVRYGFVPREHIEKCSGDFYQLDQFLNEMNFCVHGYGEEWSLDLRLREGKLLPYREVDTLLKHGVDTSSSLTIWWGKNQPDPGVMHTTSKRALIKRLYQSRFGLKRIPNVTDGFLQTLAQDVLYSLRDEAQKIENRKELEEEESAEVRN